MLHLIRRYPSPAAGVLPVEDFHAHEVAVSLDDPDGRSWVEEKYVSTLANRWEASEVTHFGQPCDLFPRSQLESRNGLPIGTIGSLDVTGWPNKRLSKDPDTDTRCQNNDKDDHEDRNAPRLKAHDSRLVYARFSDLRGVR